MEAIEIAPELWRWTGIVEAIGGMASSVYWRTGRTVVLVDPILPPEDPAGFWRVLDRDVVPISAEVHVALTKPSHTRQTAAMLARYPDARLWAHRDVVADVRARGPEVTDPFAHGDLLPGGLQALDSGKPGESLFWLAEHRTLIVADVVAVRDGGLALRSRKPAVLEALRAASALGVERVLASHGEPLLADAGPALAALLER